MSNSQKLAAILEALAARAAALESEAGAIKEALEKLAAAAGVSGR